MKRTLIVALALLLAGANAYAAAPDRVGHMELGVLGGWASNDSGADDTGYAQANIAYGVTPYIAVGAEGGWQEGDMDNDVEEVGTVQIMGDIIVRNPYWHDQLVPYGVLGLGMIARYVSNEPNAAGQQGDDADDSAFGWKLGGGLDWFLTPNWVANFEFAYFGADDMDLPGTSLNTEDASFWTVGGGLKFVF